MSAPKILVVVGTATTCLAALVAFALAAPVDPIEYPTSTCAPANCGNCMQNKRLECPLCCRINPATGQPNPNYIDDNHPAICYSFKNANLTTAIGAWCITAGSGTQKCKYLTVTGGGTACGNVLLWHCFPCVTLAADCANCPCTPGTNDMTVPMGTPTYTCTDI